MKNLLRHNAFIGLLLALAVFPVYYLTLSRTVTTEDPGELAAAIYTLGIAHPTGYPLFTLLGWAFSHLPLGSNLIWRLNLFGAVLCAVATFWFFQVFAFLVSEKARAVFGKLPDAGGPVRQRAVAAAATLTYAFSAIYWTEAVGLEVYALHLVFLALVILTFLRALAAHKTDPGPKAHRLWLLFSFTLGLSFTNHMMTVLLAPAFLYLHFKVFGWRTAWKRVLSAAPLFLLALSVYLYLPLRSAQNPVMNWGEPATPDAFWKHITAAQYGQQMFSSWDIALRKLAQFWADLPGEFGYVPLAVAALGIASLWRGGKTLLVFGFLVFAGCLFYGINYAFDDRNFYLNAHFAVAAWVAFGLLALLKGARGAGRQPARIFCAGVFLFPLCLNYSALDKSRDSAVQDYAKNVLGSMDPGAVFFSNEYERLGSPAFYLQMVEGYRPDIVVLDIILLGNPWFYGHLEQRHPWLMQASRREIDAYRAEVDKYVRGEPDTVAHNARLQEMFRSIIDKSRAAGRPVYISSGINPAAVEEYQMAAAGMVFKLLDPEEPLSVGLKDFHYAPLPKSNPLSETIRREYAEGYGNQGSYLVALGDTAGGIRRLKKALTVESNFPAVTELLNQLSKNY